MKQKNFYTAFNIIYSYLKEPLRIYQKEQFYRRIFQDIYALTGDYLEKAQESQIILNNRSTRVLQKLLLISNHVQLLRY